MRLWSEHLDKPFSDDPDAGFRLFKDAAATPTGSGRVRSFDSRVPPIPSLHALQMRSYIDPYSGPRR